MTFNDLLSSLRERDVHVWVEEDRLRYRAPPDALTTELLEQLREHKHAIIQFLTDAEISGPGRAPLAPVARDGALPLSFAQELLWFLGKLDHGSVVYNIPLALWLDGALDVAALQASLEEVVRRHEALRTRFATLARRPVQVIEPRIVLDMPVVDLSELPAARRKTEAARLFGVEARLPFNLCHDLLLRTKLFRLDQDRHALFLNVHHIAADGWSLCVLLRELDSLYEAFSAGRAPALEQLPVQYADYAVWQREELQGDMIERQVAYWKERLAGAPALLTLPTDRPRPARQSFRGATEMARLPNSLLKAVSALSQQEGASLFMTLLAAFQMLLSRYSGQEDIVVGSPIASRNRVELEGLIGFFANTLALRGDLSGRPTFRELLRRTRQATLEAYAHQDLRFEKLVDELRPERNASYNPFFQVMFSLDNTLTQPARLGALSLKREQISSGTSKFDMTMFVSEDADGLTALVEYCTDLFDTVTIRRMLGHYRSLLEFVVRDPDARIGEAPLLQAPSSSAA